MGANTLTDRSTGQTILETFFNDIHSALNGDFVGRNASGVATLGQNLGTNAFSWANGYFTNIILDGSAIDSSQLTSPVNRIVSGQVRSTSNQPQFLVPDGAAASFDLEGASTNLVLDINGSVVTVSTDITKSSLTTAPAANNTALIDDTDAADQAETRLWGESNASRVITLDAMGSSFSAKVGEWVAVKIAGVSDEYVFGFLESATELTKCYRGYFTDSSNNPVNRSAFFDNDTVTIMSLGWVFVENNGTTVDVTYNNPVWAADAPTSPVTGDYWYDIPNGLWKRYDGASFQIINRTIVGMVVIDDTNCVAARSFDFYQKFSEENTIEIEINSTEIIKAKNQDSVVSVMGERFDFQKTLPSWNITTDLAAAVDMYDATEQASTDYYLYLKDTGDIVISDISPYKRGDLAGYYHPHNPWRCIGICFNDSGSDIVAASYVPYNSEITEQEVTIKDIKAQNTPGGGFTQDAWQTRDLNSIDGNVDISTIDTNQFLVLPGAENVIKAAPMAYEVIRHQSALYNDTDSSFEEYGETMFASTGNDINTISKVEHIFTKDVSKFFEIQHKCASTRGTDGFGNEANIANEIYTQVTLIRRKK